MSTGTFTQTINQVNYGDKNLTYYQSPAVGTKTTTTIFDANFTTVGTWIEDSSTGEESFSVTIHNDSGTGYVENGFYKANTSDAGFSWTYNYDTSNVFTGGTETENGITTTLDANWAATSQKGAAGLPAVTVVSDVASLGTASTDGEIKLVTADSTVYVAVASSWEATALSGTIATYSSRDINAAGEKEITFFNVAKDIVGVQSLFVDTVTENSTTTTFKGSTFFDASGEWIGDTYSDGFLIRSTAVKSDGNGGYTESGIYKETDGNSTTLFEREFSYTFDSNGDLSSGSETVDGVTTTYGANWEVTAKAVDVGSLGISTNDAPADVPSSLAVSGKIYTTSQTQSWGDTEVTYYSAATGNASILGRAISFSNTEGSIQNYGTTYFDEAWNWIGDVFSSGDWTARRFEQDNGNGTKTETGFETDGSGWSREWVFVFKTSNGELVSGTETQNGVTTTFGPNWQIVSKSADLSSLGEVTDATALSDIPTAFVLTRDNNGTSEQYALFKTTENPWGDETTYFNASGEIIGNAFGWSYGSESGTSFNDLNGNFLGDVYIQGDRKHVRFETEVTSDGTYGTSGTTIRLETGAEYTQLLNGSWDLERSWNFYFDNNFNMLGGTETMDGITTTFGQGWQIGAVKADTSALTAISDLDVVVSGDVKLSDLYTFTAAVDGTDVTAGYQSAPKTNDWGDTEVVYYDAAGAVVGRSQQYSFDFQDMGYGGNSQSATTKTQTGTTYFDKDWNWVGDVFDDGTFSGGRFDFDLAGGGRRELGSETDGTWSRSYDFVFGSDGVLVSGSETENGITTQYGANWTVTGRTADTSNLSQETNAAVIADLPTSFVINNTAYYTEKSDPSWGTERTYFDASGTILGYSNSWNDNWGSGTSFNTADWEFLGDIFIQGNYKNVRFETKETSDGTYGTAGDTIRVETGVEYTRADENSAWVQDRSWTFNFTDQGFNMLGGTETRADGTILTFGANWQITAEKADLNSLTAISDMTEDLGAGVQLNELFDFSVTVDGQPVTNPTGYYKTEVLDFDNDPSTNDGSKTVYFNQNAEIVGRKEVFINSPNQEDFVPPLVFARQETIDGDWIDFIGIGIDGLADNYTDGEGVLIPLGWHPDVTIDANTTSQDILDMLGGKVELEQPIPSGLAYSPNEADWLLTAMGSNQLAGITVVTPADASGVVSGTIKGFVAKDINQPSPTAGAVIDVQYSSSDSLEYEYYAYGGGQFFTDPTANTSFSVANTAGTFVDVIAANVARVNANPPTNVQYFDEDFMWVGENFSSVNESRTVFNIENADGTRKEFGSEGNAYYARSWEFNFDASGNFQGGTETENGVSRNVDEFGKAELQAVSDVSSLSVLAATIGSEKLVLDQLPAALVDGTGNSAKAYYFEQKYPGGVETFYFDGSGNPLGRSQSFEDPHGGSGTDYFDATDNFIGNTFLDGSGRSLTRFETRTGQGENLVINETGSEYDGTTLIREWDFTFDKDFNLISGTEKWGSTTTTYGANWTFISESVTMDNSFGTLTANQAGAELVKIEDSATTVATGLIKLSDVLSVDTSTRYKTENYDWDGDSTIDARETTYYTANGGVIGRMMVDEFSFNDPNRGTVLQKNYTFYDEDWNWVGDYSTEGTSTTPTRAFFEVQTDANTKYEVNVDFNRKSVFEYQKVNNVFEFQGGIEIENGTKFDIGANWGRAQKAFEQSDLNALKFGTNTDPLPVEIAELPDAFKMASDEVFYKVLNNNNGDMHVEYYSNVAGTNFGKKVGESFTFTDFWSGEQVTGFNDANFEWLGEVRIRKDGNGDNVSKSVFKISDGFVDANGDPAASGTAVKVESTTQYNWTAGTPGTWTASGDSSTYRFDPNTYNLVSGEETRGGSTTKFGANWTILAEETNTAGFSAVGNTTVFNGSTIKITDLFATADTYQTTSQYHGDETKYFDTSGKVVGYKYENTFIDDANNKAFLNVFFENGDREWVGDARFEGVKVADPASQTYSRSQSFIEVRNADNTQVTEYFSEGDTGTGSSRTETLTYNIQIDGGGFETRIPDSGTVTENGTSVALTVSNGAWVRGAATVTINVGSLDASIIQITATSNPSSDLPDFSETTPLFVSAASDYGTLAVDSIFAKQTRDDTAFGGGKEFTYFSAAGNELGTAYVFTDYYSGESVVEFMKASTGPYPKLVGEVRESATRKKVMFETEIASADGSAAQGGSAYNGQTVIIETGQEYIKQGTSWVLDTQYNYILDDTYHLISGTKTIGDNTVTYGPGFVITGSTFTGSSTGLTDMNTSPVFQFLPDHWQTISGTNNPRTLKAEEDVRAPGTWSISKVYTIFEDAASTLTKLGTIDVKGTWKDVSDHSKGFSNAQVTILDADGVTQIGTASISTDATTGDVTEDRLMTVPKQVLDPSDNTLKSGYEVTYGYMVKTSLGAVDSFYAYTDSYIYAANAGDPDIYVGGYDTSNGQTVFYDANGDATGQTNDAPTITLNTPVNTFAGEVKEDGTLQASGNLTIADADVGDTLSYELFGSTDPSATVQTRVGQYGTLQVDFANPADVTYTYTLNNSLTQVQNLDDYQYEYDVFTIGAREQYHDASFDLRFAIEGTDEPVNSQGTGAFLIPSSDKVTLNLDAFFDADGFTPNSNNYQVVWKIDGVTVNRSASAPKDELSVGPSDAGKPVTAVITYTDNAGFPNSVSVGGTIGQYTPNTSITPKFSIDTTGQGDISITGYQFSASADLAPVMDGTSRYLEASDLRVRPDSIRDNISKLGTSDPLTISLDLDSIVNTYGQYEDHTIQIIIRDDKDADTYATGATEREIEVEFDVRVFGDGYGATVESVPETVNVYWTGIGHGNSGTVQLTNSEMDLIAISKTGASTSVSSPQSLNLKLEKLLSDLSTITNVDMLSALGNYSYEINNLHGLLAEEGGGSFADIDGIRGKIKVANTTDKFTLDLSTNSDIQIQGDGGFNGSANLQYSDVGGDGYLIAQNPMVVNSAAITSNINNLNSTNPLSLSFKLDNIASLSSATPHSIEIIFRDDKDTNLFDTDSSIEREIKVAFDVKVTGTGDAADIELVAGSANVQWKGTGGVNDTGTVPLTNAAADIISIQKAASGSTTFQTPAMMNLKLDKLLSDLDTIVSTNMLSAPGDYTYEVKGLDGILAYENNNNFEDIYGIRGEIQVQQSTASTTKFSLDIGKSDDISLNGRNFSADAQLGYSKVGSDGILTAQNPMVVNSSVVRDNINNMSTNGQLGFSFKLDNVITSNDQTPHTIEVVIRDVKDTGTAVYNTAANEREIKVAFDVKATGTGSSANIELVSTNTTVYWQGTGGASDKGSVSLTNVPNDTISIQGTGTVNSPSSLNLKLDTLLSELGGITNIDMLSSPGKYAYEIKGLDSLLAELDNNAYEDVDIIRGEVEVVDGASNGIDIAGLEISYNSQEAGNPRIVHDLQLQQANDGNGDNFLDISLENNKVILASDINSLGNPGVTFAPNIAINLGSVADTGANPFYPKVSIQILEIDDSLNNTQDGPYTRDFVANNAERMVEVLFDLKMEGDGTTETWTSVPNSNMVVNVWGSNSADASPNTFNVPNGDVDTFVATKQVDSSTSNSLEIKLNDLLSSIKGNIPNSLPVAQANDEFLLQVAFVDQSDNYDILLSGDFILS